MASIKKGNGILKISALLLLFTLTASASKAQTWDEWFRQKKTQIKYMTQQIAALETYSSYLKQGYNIATNGLGNIKGFTGGEFGLHQGYYDALKTVNPEIKDDPKAAASVQYLAAVPGKFDQLNSLAGLSADNHQYTRQVAAKVLAECQADLDELHLIMTSGDAEMTDDERLKRLDQVYTRAKDKYAFTVSFCNHVRMMLIQQVQEQQSLQTLKNYHGINQ